MIALPYLSQYRVLVVPGLHDSGDGHWQTRWEQLYPQFERVQQDDWAKPDLPRWSQRMAQALNESDKPVFIIAHSFGCLTTMQAASHERFKLAGATGGASQPGKIRCGRLSCAMRGCLARVS